MLIPYSQFTLTQAVRTPMQLVSPPITAIDAVSIPRQSVIHSLDMDTEVCFPDREDYKLRNIPSVKKVPVLHVYDATEQKSVTAVQNKAVLPQIALWKREHNRSFRELTMLSGYEQDLQVNLVINYNLLKSRYRYAETALAQHDKRNNILKTYWDTVVLSIKSMPESRQFVTFKIPAIIPGNTAITSLLKQNETVYARVISDPHLNALVHVYMYLNTQTRHRSAMRNLSVEQTEKVDIELSHRGYSAFFKLSYLLCLSEENDLPSKRKISADKVQRLFVLMLLDVQTQAAMLYDKSAEQNKPPEQTTAVVTPEDEEVKDVSQPEQTVAKLVELSPRTSNNETPELKISELDKRLENTVAVDEFDSAVAGATIDDKLESLSYTDDLFMSAITKFSDQGEHEDTTLTVDYSEDHINKLISDLPVASIHEDYIQKAKASGAVTTADIRNLRKLIEVRSTLKAPGTSMTIDQAKVINPVDLLVTPQDKRLNINNDLVPERYKTEVLFKTDEIYLSKTLPKDVLSCVTHLERANVVVKAYEVEKVKAVTGFYDVHKLTLKPLGGKESTVYFRLPDINREGEFMASGIKYRMRRQRTDLPIRKISPTRVALTTNYGKLFVLRTEKKAYDSLEYLVDKIKKSYLAQDGSILKVISGHSYDNTRKTPNTYAKLSMSFTSVQTPDHTFVFSDKETQTQIDPAIYAAMKATQTPYSASSLFPCGYTAKKEIILLKPDNQVYLYSPTGDHTLIGPIEELLGLAPGAGPKSFSVVKVLGDAIPLGVVLSYYLGLKGLIAATQTTFTTIGANQRHTPAPDETVLRFSDVKLILKTDTVDKQLLFAGFLYYKDFIKTHEFITFDDKNIYLDLISHWDASVMHLKELDTLRVLFVDPISERVLKSMDEPHEYIKLMLRANNLLSDLDHPDVNDMNFSRIRGYDRVPGLMYRVLSESIRIHRIKGNGKGKIELDPYKVWNTITQDTTVKITEETNPIVDAKEAESATFSGADGLNKTATPELMRRYHKSDKGVISEATVDSSDVGLNFFLTPGVNFTDVNGRPGTKSDSPDANFSTSALLAPMCEYDD